MSAAVGDYKPEHAANGKIKKTADDMNLKLVRTKDILAELGERKKKKQVLVGFALETDNEKENAKEKRERAAIRSGRELGSNCWRSSG